MRMSRERADGAVEERSRGWMFYLDPQTGEVRATFGTDGCSADEDEVFCGVQQGDDGALAIWRLP